MERMNQTRLARVAKRHAALMVDKFMNGCVVLVINGVLSLGNDSQSADTVL